MAIDTGSEEPVTVTESAASEALELIEQQDLPEEGGLRLFVEQGGCSGLSYGMQFEEQPREDDIVTNQHGLSVFVDPKSLQFVGGSIIDYEVGLHESGFQIDNPNETSSCGCGESFQTEQTGGQAGHGGHGGHAGGGHAQGGHGSGGHGGVPGSDTPMSGVNQEEPDEAPF